MLLANDPDCILGLLSPRIPVDARGKTWISDRSARSSFARSPNRRCSKASLSERNCTLTLLSLGLSGDLERALEGWEAILREFPLDILALRLAQFMTSYLGKSAAIRDSVSRVFPSWSESIPGYGFVLGCYAYGLEEAGDYALAETFGRQAVEQ